MTKYEELQVLCMVVQRCLPDSPFRKEVERLHDELLAEIKKAYIKGSDDCYNIWVKNNETDNNNRA